MVGLQYIKQLCVPEYNSVEMELANKCVKPMDIQTCMHAYVRACMHAHACTHTHTHTHTLVVITKSVLLQILLFGDSLCKLLFLFHVCNVNVIL